MKTLHALCAYVSINLSGLLQPYTFIPVDLIKKLHRLGSSQAQKSLGLSIDCTRDKEQSLDTKRSKIYIANHDSVIDVLWLNNKLKIPTLISKLQIAQWPVKNMVKQLELFEHILFDKSLNQEKSVALKQAIALLEKRGEIFIFPSKGIRPITTYFSESIAFLARQCNAEIIPLYLKYTPEELFVDTKKTDFNYIKDVFLSRENKTLTVKYGPAFYHQDYPSRGDLTQALQAFYQCAKG